MVVNEVVEVTESQLLEILLGVVPNEDLVLVAFAAKFVLDSFKPKYSCLLGCELVNKACDNISVRSLWFII